MVGKVLKIGMIMGLGIFLYMCIKEPRIMNDVANGIRDFIVDVLT